jgi:hypothetical protein
MMCAATRRIDFIVYNICNNVELNKRNRNQRKEFWISQQQQGVMSVTVDTYYVLYCNCNRHYEPSSFTPPCLCHHFPASRARGVLRAVLLLLAVGLYPVVNQVVRSYLL